MKPSLIILGLCCLFQTTLFAQPPGWDPSQMTSGGVGGMVYNTEDEIPFEYANVIVSDMEGNMIKGIITDVEGKFMVRNIPFGQPFSVEISFIGFQSYRVDSMVVNKETPFHMLGQIDLRTDAALLQEVVVTGEKAVVQTSLDKKTYNVEKDAVTKSKSVSDVLNELPSVNVDADGNITLRGNSNVRILVDGDAGLAQSGEIALILQQIPAESVEKIDIVTNPSAKYDPEGTSGIINIILKKEKQRGINGTVTAGIGTWNKYNAGTFISYRKNKFSLTANYNFRYYDSFSDGEFKRTTFSDAGNSVLSQVSDSENDNMSHFARLGFTYAPNDRNTLSFGALGNIFFFNRDARLETRETNEGIEFNHFTRNTDFNGSGVWYSAYINNDFKLKRENTSLKYGANYSSFTGDFDGGYRQDSLTDMSNFFDSEQETEVDATSYNLDLNVDLELPLSETMSQEFGFKSSLRWRVGDFVSRSKSNESRDLFLDTDLINDYTFFEQVHAIYGNHIHSIKNFSYQIGLRLEQVWTNNQSVTYTDEQNFERSYFSWFPSVFLRQSFGKEDALSKHEIQLSYSRRINRPSFRITNPFRDFSDPQNPREGNPNLQPEYINSFELGYNKVWEKVTFNSSVFYRLTEDLFTRVSTLIDEENNVVLGTIENLGTQHDVGFEIINRYKVLDWWDINMDFNITQIYIRGTGSQSDLNNEGLTYGAKVSSTMNVWKGMEIQLIGRYRGPRIGTQGESDGYPSMDITIKQDIMKKKGTITFSANDIFNSVERTNTLNGDGFESVSTNKRETRIFWLTFSYGFGSMGEMFNRRARNQGGGGSDDGGGDEGGVF